MSSEALKGTGEGMNVAGSGSGGVAAWSPALSFGQLRVTW